jgi:hypothetical protein
VVGSRVAQTPFLGLRFLNWFPGAVPGDRKKPGKGRRSRIGTTVCATPFMRRRNVNFVLVWQTGIVGTTLVVAQGRHRGLRGCIEGGGEAERVLVARRPFLGLRFLNLVSEFAAGDPDKASDLKPRSALHRHAPQKREFCSRFRSGHRRGNPCGRLGQAQGPAPTGLYGGAGRGWTATDASPALVPRAPSPLGPLGRGPGLKKSHAPESL